MRACGAAARASSGKASALGKKPVSPQELRDAQNYLAGKFVHALESQAGLVLELFETEFYHKPADYLATYRDRVFAVTPADVQALLVSLQLLAIDAA